MNLAACQGLRLKIGLLPDAQPPLTPASHLGNGFKGATATAPNSGHTKEDILAAYPYLEKEDICAALAYAAW